MLKPELPHFDDPEGSCLPPPFTKAVDAHVHVFPKKIFQAIQDWFDAYAWKIRYRLHTRDIFQFLLDKGLSHIIALQYAHKKGIADALNTYLAEQIKPFKGKVSGMATVFPGEPDAAKILKRGFASGLSGVKLHAHVQCFDMTAPYMEEIYRSCRDWKKPLIMHVGREPKSPEYSCDPNEICSAEKLEQVVSSFPALKVCVPHLGFDETQQYRKLLEKYDNLWTDTTMVLCDYFPLTEKINLARWRADRIMYGSDFPNIPYEWDRELKVLSKSKLSEDIIERILYRNAFDFLSISP